MDKLEREEDSLLYSRVFSTDVGVRNAEPCSVSVAATHQLLTNLFEYISAFILSNEKFRKVTGAVITELDLRTLERTNQTSVQALTEIVGTDRYGISFQKIKAAHDQLRQAGDVWADHVLEVAKAYVVTILYIFSTVISGYPLAYAIAYGVGLDMNSKLSYLGKCPVSSSHTSTTLLKLV